MADTQQTMIYRLQVDVAKQKKRIETLEFRFWTLAAMIGCVFVMNLLRGAP